MYNRHLVIAVALAVLLSPALGEPVSEAEGSRLVKAYFRAQKTGTCNVHHIRMQRKLVPIAWGYVEFDPVYDSAEIRTFPNAREYVNGGCVVDEKKLGHLVPHYICPECKRAERHWALRHRDNSNAKWILSHTHI